jgi:hypothetical protein
VKGGKGNLGRWQCRSPAMVKLAARAYNVKQLKESPMQKRDRLRTLLLKTDDKQFNAIWKETYGYVPIGDRADLVRDFVAEQFDGELDGCIKHAESLLKPASKPKVNKWLAPR